jgi:rSAM/selenodomain-associated transferase 1
MTSTPDMASTPEKIIVFLRYPYPGAVKTRLIPVLGSEGAAELQRRMTEHTVKTVRRMAVKRNVSIEVCFDGGNEKILRQWLGDDLEYQTQSSGNLGDRMESAFERSFKKGAQRIVIIGTDCPDQTDELMISAFRSLEQKDMVLGPARDGGYYLIGLSRPIPALFEGIRWGTGEVTGITLKIALDLGFSNTLLPELDDVDRPEDLAVWDRIVGDHNTTTSGTRISVIIPTLNEARNIVAAVNSAQNGGADEILVVDGGRASGF